MLRPMGDQPDRPYRCKDSLSLRERVRMRENLHAEVCTPGAMCRGEAVLRPVSDQPGHPYRGQEFPFPPEEDSGGQCLLKCVLLANGSTDFEFLCCETFFG